MFVQAFREGITKKGRLCWKRKPCHGKNSNVSKPYVCISFVLLWCCFKLFSDSQSVISSRSRVSLQVFNPQIFEIKKKKTKTHFQKIPSIKRAIHYASLSYYTGVIIPHRGWAGIVWVLSVFPSFRRWGSARKAWRRFYIWITASARRSLSSSKTPPFFYLLFPLTYIKNEIGLRALKFRERRWAPARFN